jgi:hypothetical protein
MKHWTRWTKDMNQFLLDNYEWIGDKRLSELFEERFPKHFRWTLKHIEKRRNYMKLKRTPEAVLCIKLVNNLDNDLAKLWDIRGRSHDGTVKDWRGRKFIKVDGKYVPYNRHTAGAKKGEVVRLIDGELRIITMADNVKMNREKALSLPLDLQHSVKALNQLKKLIYGKENTRST